MVSFRKVRSEAAGCRRCDLYRDATQTVFGEGPVPAALMMVGEQPGDVEDREGRPFTGPAGRLLDRAIAEAGLDRDTIYLTNTVKHFKHTMRGKRRIHAKPNQTEIAACLPWLETELSLVKPDIVVALGSTAAQALLGKAFRVTKSRGTLIPLRDFQILATVHPSSILRSPNRDAAYDAFLADLAPLASRLSSG